MADLRFERTEKMLQLSFLELLKTSSFNEISIAKLAQASLIDRTTFYTHYENLSELADTVIQETLAPFSAAFSTSQQLQQQQNFDNYSFFSHELVDHLLTHRVEIEAVRSIPLGTNSFDHRLRQLFTQIYTSLLNLPATDFTIFLLVNLAISNFDFILQNQRIPSKKELRSGLKRMEHFLE